jgi:hypothetical protein
LSWSLLVAACGPIRGLLVDARGPENSKASVLCVVVPCSSPPKQESCAQEDHGHYQGTMVETNGSSFVWCCTILDPRKNSCLHKDDDDFTVGQLRGCFLDVFARMMEDDETRDKIDAQSRDYEFLRGNAFSNKLAIQNLESVSPSKCTLIATT